MVRGDLALEKPEWLTIRYNQNNNFSDIKNIIKENHLNSVCQESKCPNLSECWSSGTVTFMILGNKCTRNCGFCNTKTNKTGCLIDEKEPENISNAIKKLKIFDYVVLTSVCRDDLEDSGSKHYAECIKKIKEDNPNLILETLIPDFSLNLLKNIVNEKPNVISHNIETVKRLQKNVRDNKASYNKSLDVLNNIKTLNNNIYTKSSLMLGLGEKREEVEETMNDLREAKVDILTIGQYLRPSLKHLEVKEYASIEKFNYYRDLAFDLGFLSVASGPFVRSSYKAGELFLR